MALKLEFGLQSVLIRAPKKPWVPPMSVMGKLRAYHALLAISATAAYLSGELGLIHAWLGYSVAAFIVLRLILALTGAPQLGLMRFYPHFDGLNLGNAITHPMVSRTILLGIAGCVVGATLTGIALDGGRALGLASPPATLTPPSAASNAEDEFEHERGGERDNEREEGPLGEAHELFANALALLVGAHVTYLFLFKRPLARFMLFADANKNPKP